MASLRIDSGPLSPTYRFLDIPKDRWRMLVREKRDFLATRIKHDCRCLIEFCEEANEVWETLDYKSAADMIRNGYELDPQQIELAVEWLKINEPDSAVGIDVIAEAIATKEKAKRGPKPKDSISTNLVEIGSTNTNKNVLRRLARDNPDILEQVKSGELSVNAAAIQAGIRKKPTQAEICVKAWRKTETRLETLKAIASDLQPHEWAWLLEQQGE